MEKFRGVCSCCQTVWGVVNPNTPVIPVLSPGSLERFDEMPVFLLEQHRIPGSPRFCDGSGRGPETLTV